MKKRALLIVSICLFGLSGAVFGQDHHVIQISPDDARSAVEVSVAINPVDIDNIIAGAIMRGYPKAANPNYTYHTLDGGKTWKTVATENPNSRIQGDDVVVFDGEGNAIHGYISFEGIFNKTPVKGSSGIFIDCSSDKGKTWSKQVPVVDHINSPTPMEDKPWFVFDRNPESKHFGSLYCSWTRFDVYGSKDEQDTTQIVFARRLPGKDNFSPVTRVSDKGGDCVDDDNTVEGATPSVGIDGTVYVVWSGPRGIEMDKSTDGGKTFGKDSVISDHPGGWANEVEGINRANGMPVTAVDHSNGPDRGRLYVNWIDERNKDKDVFLISSKDGGKTWTDRVRVNDDPLKNGRDQFFTWMAVDPTDGSVNIAFYDRRATEGAKTRLTLARSIDGGKTFKNFHISKAVEFDCKKSAFFGDYLNVDAQKGRVVVAYAHFKDGTKKLAVSTAIYDFKPGTLETK